MQPGRKQDKYSQRGQYSKLERIISTAFTDNEIFRQGAFEKITTGGGASEQAVNESTYFRNIEKVTPIRINSSHCKVIETLHQGIMAVKLQNITLVMRIVYYAHSSQLNVRSWSRLDEQGITVTFSNMACLLSNRHDRNMLLGIMMKDKDGLFKSRIQQANKMAQVSTASSRARQERYQ